MSKGNPLLSARIPPDLNELLEQKTQESGESKTNITIAALLAYLQPATPEDELAKVKQRLQQVETMIQGWKKHFPS